MFKGCCEECNEGMQILANAMVHIHDECEDNVFEMVFQMPDYIFKSVYQAQQKILTILSKEFANVPV